MSSLSRRAFLGSAALACGVRPAAPAASPSSAPNLRRSQLFLDDTWIEETARLQRVWSVAEIVPEPALKPQAPWEGMQLTMFGSVFRLQNEWRMYYQTYNRPQLSYFCLATSHDGLQWERPNLGLVEFRGSKANNILWAPAPGEGHDGPTVCHDPDDARAPFKILYYGYGPARRGVRTGTPEACVPREVCPSFGNPVPVNVRLSCKNKSTLW